MKTKILLAGIVFLLFANVRALAQKTVDCFIIDNPTTNNVDVYVVAKGGSYTSEQWNDMVICLSIPDAGGNLGALGSWVPNYSTPAVGSTFLSSGATLAKQPVGTTTPSFTDALNTRKYFTYTFAGLTNTFTANFNHVGFPSGPTGQEYGLPENTPVFMGGVPKNGNAFSTIEIHARLALETDAAVIANNAPFYIEINNLDNSGNVYKEDIIHFNNRLNENPVVPAPQIWRGGTDATAEPDLTDAARSLTIYSGPAVKTMIGAVASTTFLAETNIEVNPDAGLQTTTVTHSTSGNDSIIIKADATGYGQYIGPPIAGSAQQFVGTSEGWRNVSFPIVPSSTSMNKLDLGGAPANFDGTSTSHHVTSATTDACGSFGNWVSTTNVYEFKGSAGAAGPDGDHEWYAASVSIGGNKGYSVFVGSSFFPTTGIVTIKGMLQDGTVANYAYSNEAPHAAGATGASQQNFMWEASCAPQLSEAPADRKANYDGWVLMANPFPCGLDVDAFSTTNGITNTNVRVWNRGKTAIVIPGQPDDPDYSYESMAGKIIPPMQAFYVKIGVAPHAQAVQFLNTHRAFSGEAFLKTGNEDIYVIAMNTLDSATNHTILDFEPTATKGYDMLHDSYVLSQPGSTMPQVGFHNESSYTYGGSNHQIVSPMYVNTVNGNVAQDSYPMRFWSRSAGNFSFRLDQARLNSSWKIYIEDTKLAPGVSNEITNSTYNFSYTTADSPTRFILHFVNTAIGIDEFANGKWGADAWFTSNGELNVKLSGYNLTKFANISLHDLTGKELIRGQRMNTENTLVIDNSFPAGMYVLVAEDENGDSRVVKVMKTN